MLICHSERSEESHNIHKIEILRLTPQNDFVGQAHTVRKIVGQSIPRLDGLEKACGTAIYIDDITYPNMWYGAVARATIPRGRIKSISFDSQFDWSKVVLADHRDIPGKNVVTMIKDDQPFLVSELVNHYGEAVVLVAAPTAEMAMEAAAHIRIEYEELEPVLTIEEARKGTVPIQKGDCPLSILASYEIKKGDIAQGFAESDVIVDGEYRTGHAEHAYLEPHGVIAIPEDGGVMKILGTLQCPYYVHKAIYPLLNLPPEKVVVIQTVTGGAFGGKEDYPSLLAGYAAILARKTTRPIKIIYDRATDMLVTTKRHPSIVRHKTGVKKDGTIVAMEIAVEFDGGAYATLSPVVLARGLLHSTGPYRVPNVHAVATCYVTNTVPNGAFRGFGAPQTLFAIESHMDVIAAKLGLSPLEIRRKNCLRVGDETSTGQVLKESVGALKCLEAVAKGSGFEKKWKRTTNDACPPPPGADPPLAGALQWRERRATSDERRTTSKGIGLSLFMHGAGFTGSGEAIMKGRAAIRLEKDGRITILTGCTDMGQGAATVLPQIVAEALGIPIGRVRMAQPDTSVVPDSGPTVASRTTMVVGKVLTWCCEELKKRIIPPAPPLEKGGEGGFTIERHYELPPGIKWDQDRFWGDAYPTYAWGAYAAEVEVDMTTFEVRVTNLTSATDVGKAINPQAVEGQIEGGALQALGFALMENVKHKDGKVVNNKLQTYIIPTVKDAPAFKTIIVEDPFSWGPFGAKGLGELPLDGGAPAIANAIYDAIGIRVTELPITAEKIQTENFKIQTSK